jgi:hypothetical protein
MKSASITNKERYQFDALTGYDEIVITLSDSAGRWLAGTTRTSDSYIVGNRTLFCDLLSRMQLMPTTVDGFRRPQFLNAGQAQYSELQLQEEWGIGRKVIRRLLNEMESVGLIEVEKSTVASTVTFPCINGWSINYIWYENPYRDHNLHVLISQKGGLL